MAKFIYECLENKDGRALSMFSVKSEAVNDRTLAIQLGADKTIDGSGYFVLTDVNIPIDVLFSAPYVPMILHGSRVYEDDYITEDGDKVMFVMFSTKDNTLVIMRVSTDKSEEDLLNVDRYGEVYMLSDFCFSSVVSAIEVKREALDFRQDYPLGKLCSQWACGECDDLGSILWDSIYSTFLNYNRADFELVNLFGLVDYVIARKSGILVSSEDYDEDSDEVGVYELDEYTPQNIDDVYEFGNSLMPDGFRCLNVEMLEKISDVYALVYGDEDEDEDERFRVSAFGIYVSKC